MRIGIESIRKFFALPEGKQFLAALIIAVGTLCTVIVWQEMGKAEVQRQLDAKNRELLVILKSDAIVLQAVRDSCESERARIYNSMIAELQERSNAKERQLDAIMEESYNILKNQRKTEAKLQNINKTVNTLTP